jgi:hypothetical protein
MADKSIDITPTFYTEDVKITGTGSVLIANPAVVWTLVAALETSGVATISFSDDANGYNSAHRIGKIVINGPTTDWNGFGKGWNLTRGLSCISNLASVDIWGVAE